MSQTFEWPADSEVIDYYNDIVWDADPYLSMINQFDFVSIVDDTEDYLIKIEEKSLKIKNQAEVKAVQDLNEYELIEIPGKPKGIDKIKLHYNNLQEYGDNITLGKAIEKGAKYVREYYNQKNLRRRIK